MRMPHRAERADTALEAVNEGGGAQVVIVDWLGRGGIAQTSAAWSIELERAGAHNVIVTREGRELGAPVSTLTVPDGRSRVVTHRRLAQHAAVAIRALRPQVVVIQNYVLPVLEAPVYRAAAQVGARIISVVHDFTLNSRLSGIHAGLSSHLRESDEVIAHTPFVAAEIAQATGRKDVSVIPHPVQVGMVGDRTGGLSARPAQPGPERRAVHFGVLRRNYKGTDVALALAQTGVAGWRFAFYGVGAPPPRPNIDCIGAFLDPSVLVGEVGRSDVTVLPYRKASQSGAVVLSQVLGSVVLVSAVGGIPDQVVDGSTGILLPAGAPVAAWRRELEQLTPDRQKDIAVRAEAAAWESHDRFVRDLRALVV